MDENNDVVMLSQAQQEAKQLKLEQMRIEKEVCDTSDTFKLYLIIYCS